MTGTGLRSLQIRGRHLFVADVAVMVASMALAWPVSGSTLPLWGAAFVILARLSLAVSGRVYQQARRLDTVADLARLALPCAGGSVLGYGLVLRERLAEAATVRAAAADSVIALFLILVLRMGLAAAGVGRRREIEAQPAGDTGDLPRDLEQMLETLRMAPPAYRPSRFWQDLSRRHLAHLASEQGYRHFKRTVNTSYFQFGAAGFWRSVPTLLLEWLRRPRLNVFTARVEGGAARRGLATLVALYANAVARRPQGGLLCALDEPASGDPLIVRVGENAVSEDLCHSVEEFDSVVSALPSAVPLGRALELGAGYGRLAYVWLEARPEVQYYIADIPPALYLSQRYLQEVLPDLPVFRFRPFRDYAEIADEMSRARLIFLEPQQLELLPDDHIDLFMTVSTLHEMRPDQVANYFAIADRLCRGAFYSKQWRSFYNDVDGTTLTRDTYPVPERWRLVVERTPLVPRSFFEALYLCRP